VRIAVARELAPGEARVAMVPDLVGKLRAAGYEVAVQAGAGASALMSDVAYEAAGALVTEHPFDEADVVLSVQPLDARCLAPLPSGASTISFFPYPERSGDVALRRDRKLTTFGMEYVPRISRAQSMDALSSQALVAGYRGAIVAAGMLGQFFPLSMTAAGTIPPAQVVVLGAGVAGLQAIATCRRLGAVVKGYDVRAAAAEEIRSMGAQAIELPLPTLEGAGGYAREMTEDRAQRQRELLASYIAAGDALITTAAVPGRRAPPLVTTEMILQMGPGSVVVDLAAEAGGNVEGVVAGSVVRVGPVQLWGGANVPSQMPGPASRLYAHNVLNVIMLMTRDGRFAPDFADEITAAMCVTHAGQVRRPASGAST
jgi:proton-translocating NAD(P)+ transhydrogenase subunit alpha